jgi:uncharacterized membrane protein
MHLTKYEIFKKCWLWSVVCGIAVGSLFWFITSFGNWFYRVFGDKVAFFDVFVVLAIVGCYFGAGYIGWRIADKYYHNKADRFRKRYIQYSVLSFLLLVVIVYSPLSFLGILWSLVAPYCAVQALAFVKILPKSSKSK